MESLITYAFSVFMGFFAIMNPIANTPVFLGLTEGESQESRKKIAKVASLLAFAIVVVFILAGTYIFELFGITLPAFKITGGILVFYVGFEMLMSKQSAIDNNNTKEARNVAVSPLAIPILSGPGTIVTAVNYVTNASFVHISIVIFIFAIIVYLNYLAFSLSKHVFRIVGQNLILVIGKLMGLILAIIGTGMVTEGIKLSFDL